MGVGVGGMSEIYRVVTSLDRTIEMRIDHGLIILNPNKNGHNDDNHDDDFMNMEMRPTWTGPTIVGMSSVEQSVRFDILAPGLNFNTQIPRAFLVRLYKLGDE